MNAYKVKVGGFAEIGNLGIKADYYTIDNGHLSFHVYAINAPHTEFATTDPLVLCLASGTWISVSDQGLTDHVIDLRLQASK